MRKTESTIHVRALRERVWAVLTDPSYVRQWQYGSILETDWSVGSPIRFTSEWDGRTFEQWGTVLSVEAPSSLRYSLFAPRPDLEDRPENYFTMTYTLDAAEGGTKVTVSQEDPREDADDVGVDGGENPVMAALKELAESER